MKLKQSSLWFSVAVMFLLSANTFFMVMIHRAHTTVVAVQEHRKDALALANELRRETEQLTSLVRAYTSTGETRYLTYYYDVLAIRQGEKPHPDLYDPGTYWDMAVAGNITHQFPVKGDQRPLASRMRALGFSESELGAFGRVSAATEAMKQVEQVAFAATQGLYDPVKNDFVSDGDPRMEFARQQVYSPQYNKLKAGLAIAVAELGGMVDRRTTLEMGQAAESLEWWIILALVSMGLTFAMMLAASQVIRRRVLQPIDLLSKTAHRIAQGDYSSRTWFGVDKQQAGAGVAELRALGDAFDSMAGSIEQDIAMRQQTQRHLEEANYKAEEATRAKSFFLANMSHEIRTPMNAIIGMAYLALRTELTPRQRDYIDNVYKAAKSLLGIINDILDFSKVEANKLELEQVRFVLEDVAANSLALMRQSAQEKEIELLFDVTDPRLLGDCGALMGDALRLGQVLTNLLSNAVKFTHKGFVRLSVRIEDSTPDDVLVRFSIRDTGIGMTEEQIGRLFQQFTQADGSTTRQYGGSGLGLIISKKYVELMGGEVGVDSVAGEGSEFFFTTRFPIAKPGSPVFAVLPGVDTLRVLIADDQPEARMVLADLLMVLGVGSVHQPRIECASTGAQAVQMIRAGLDAGTPYDLLLLDWMMPEMDGGAVLQALWDSGLRNPPLSVVVSAYDSDVIHEAAERLGAKHFLAKPVLPEALRRMLHALTGHQPTNFKERVEDTSPLNLNGMRVLLVEDNAINQQLAVELLEMRGIEVSIANHGKEAITQLDALAPDHFHVVLMDLQMPVMDGYEATRRLRADARYFSLPVIAMTAHAMFEERERCQALGMSGHLSKPMEPDDIYRLLGQYYTASDELSLQKQGAAPASGLIRVESKSELPSLVGLNTASGLRRSGGNALLYLELLDLFLQGHLSFETDFTEMIASNQWQDAHRLAHTLRGSAATLGADSLVQPASDLEAACKSQDAEVAARAFTALLPVLSVMLAGLQRHLESEPVASLERVQPMAEHAPAMPEEPPETLPQLLALLIDCDGEAIDLWGQTRSQYARILTVQRLRRVDVALQNFEFDSAHALLMGLPSAVARIENPS